MEFQECINIIIASAAILGIFLNVVSNIQIKRQTELQYKPFVRLTDVSNARTLDRIDIKLKIENIGVGIAKNISVYSSMGVNDKSFDGKDLSKMIIETLSPGELHTKMIDDGLVNALMVMNSYSHYNVFITYEDIFNNMFFVQCIYESDEKQLKFMRSTEPVKLKSISKRLFLNRLKNSLSTNKK